MKLHFVPTYCPHLNQIERLWDLMHRNVTHIKCDASCVEFANALVYAGVEGWLSAGSEELWPRADFRGTRSESPEPGMPRFAVVP